MSEHHFDAVQIARVTAKAEGGLLSAYEWMPYPSDIEDSDLRAKLTLAIEQVTVALGVIREVRNEAERRVGRSGHSGMTLINLQRLREDAEHLTALGSDPVAERLAHNLLLILDNPFLLISAEYAIVRKPELLGKGVPQHG